MAFLNEEIESLEREYLNGTFFSTTTISNAVNNQEITPSLNEKSLIATETVLFALSDSFSHFLGDTERTLHSLESIRKASLMQHIKLSNRMELFNTVESFIDRYFFSPELIQKLKDSSQAAASDSGVDVDFVMVYLPELEFKLQNLQQNTTGNPEGNPALKMACMEDLQKRSFDLKLKACIRLR